MNNFKKTITYLLCLAFFVFFTLKKDIIFTGGQKSHENENKEMLFEEDFESTVLKAKEENKFIFIDCYTDWCYWCKVLDTATFQNTEFASFMNSKFVNLKINAEKDFGKSIAMKYFVRGYPTAIILDKDLNLKGKISGFSKPEEYKKQVIKIMGNKKTKMSNIIDTNIYDPMYSKMFREKIGGKYKKNKRPKKEEIEFFFTKETDYNKEENFAMIWRFSQNCPDKILELVKSNKKEFKKRFGENAVNDVMYSYYSRMLQKAIDSNNEENLDNIISMALDIWGKDQKEMITFNTKSEFYLKTKNCQKIIEITDNFIKQNKSKDINSTINSLSWDFYENIEEKTCLKAAISWMESLSNLKPYEIDTHAALLYKIGEYNKAKTKAEEAISKGILQKDSMLSTRELLIEIENKINLTTN